MLPSFGQKIKAARKEKNLTQRQLAILIGAKHNSISDWENDKNRPDPDTIELLCGVLSLSPSYLLDSNLKGESLSPSELNLIKKYRKLSPYQQGTIDINIDRMLNEPAPAQSVSDVVPITSYRRIASAGRGEYLFDDIPSEIIYVPNTETARRADFVIGVNGDSMEPDYFDGDQVFVQKTDEIPVGAVGIFVKGEDCFIKEMGTDRLISHNKKYADIIPNEEIRLIGEVIGKVNE